MRVQSSSVRAWRAKAMAEKMVIEIEILTAILENVLAHQGGYMTEGDREARQRSLERARTLLREIEGA